MTVAVTGATGFLGSHITLELLARETPVRGVVRSPEKGAWLEARGATLARADLADRDALKRAFEGAEAVVSNAALFTWSKRSWEDFYRANQEGTENVMRAAAESGVRRVIHVSTSGVYRLRFNRTTGTDAPRLRRLHRFVYPAYTVTKALSEDTAWELAREHGLDLTVVRPGPIYGPRDRNMIPIYERMMQRRIAPAPSFGLPVVHAGDVAIAIANALQTERAIGKSYNLASEPVSIRDWMRAWKTARGEGPILVPIPGRLFLRYDTADARRDLHFTSRPILDGLRETFREDTS